MAKSSESQYTSALLTATKALTTAVGNLYKQSEKLNNSVSKVADAARQIKSSGGQRGENPQVPILNKILRELGLIRIAMQKMGTNVQRSQTPTVSERKGRGINLIQQKQPEPVMGDQSENKRDQEKTQFGATSVLKTGLAQMMGVMGVAVGKKIEQSVKGAWDKLIDVVSDGMLKVRNVITGESTNTTIPQRGTIVTPQNKAIEKPAVSVNIGQEKRQLTGGELTNVAVKSGDKSDTVKGVHEETAQSLENNREQAKQQEQIRQTEIQRRQGGGSTQATPAVELNSDNSKKLVESLVDKLGAMNLSGSTDANERKSMGGVVQRAYLTERAELTDKYKAESSSLEDQYKKQKIDEKAYEERKNSLRENYERSNRLVTAKWAGGTEIKTGLAPNAATLSGAKVASGDQSQAAELEQVGKQFSELNSAQRSEVLAKISQGASSAPADDEKKAALLSYMMSEGKPDKITPEQKNFLLQKGIKETDYSGLLSTANRIATPGARQAAMQLESSVQDLKSTERDIAQGAGQQQVTVQNIQNNNNSTGGAGGRIGSSEPRLMGPYDPYKANRSSPLWYSWM